MSSWQAVLSQSAVGYFHLRDNVTQSGIVNYIFQHVIPIFIDGILLGIQGSNTIFNFSVWPNRANMIFSSVPFKSYFRTTVYTVLEFADGFKTLGFRTISKVTYFHICDLSLKIFKFWYTVGVLGKPIIDVWILMKISGSSV